MRHDGHALLPHGSKRTLITYLARTAGKQAGDVAFHDRAAIATGTGQVHLVRGALAVQARLSEDVVDFLRTGMRLKGLSGLGDANREYPALMERLPQRRIIDAEITRHRMDLAPWGGPDTLDGPLDLVEQGQHITGIARIALRDPVRKDEPRGGLRHQAGFAAKLGGAIALAFEDGGNGGIVRIDNFTMTEFFALREAYGLGTDVGMGIHRRV